MSKNIQEALDQLRKSIVAGAINERPNLEAWNILHDEIEELKSDLAKAQADADKWNPDGLNHKRMVALLARVAAMEKALQSCRYVMNTSEKTYDEKLVADALFPTAENPMLKELEELRLQQRNPIMPGAWICERCKFVLQKNVLYAGDGSIRADSSPLNEKCPNDGQLMRPFTWREANDGFAEDNRKLRTREQELVAFLEEQLRITSDGWGSFTGDGARAAYTVVLSKINHLKKIYGSS